MTNNFIYVYVCVKIYTDMCTVLKKLGVPGDLKVKPVSSLDSVLDSLGE